jgi:uncharacterized membrane protein
LVVEARRGPTREEESDGRRYIVAIWGSIIGGKRKGEMVKKMGRKAFSFYFIFFLPYPHKVQYSCIVGNVEPIHHSTVFFFWERTTSIIAETRRFEDYMLAAEQ